MARRKFVCGNWKMHRTAAEARALVAELRGLVSSPDFYQRPGHEVQQTLEAFAAAERDLEVAVERWAELEQLAEAAANATQRPSDG